MEITPNLDSFSKVYDLGKNYLVYTILSADLDTTVSLMLKLTEQKKIVLCWKVSPVVTQKDAILS